MYLLIGILNNVIGFGLIFLLMYMGLYPEISNTIGYLVGFLISFYLNKKFNFKSNGQIKDELSKFGVSMLVAYLVNLGVLIFLVRLLDVNKYVSQIVAGGFYVLVGYTMSKSWVFRRSK